MSQQTELVISNKFHVDFNQVEQIILMLADEFKVSISWDKNTAVITSVCALVGGFIGGRFWGKMGATIGAGISGATGLAVCTLVPLREVWINVKGQLRELYYIVLNYLQGLSPGDYVNAFVILMQCKGNRWELIGKIVDFMAEKLGREICFKLTAA